MALFQSRRELEHQVHLSYFLEGLESKHASSKGGIRMISMQLLNELTEPYAQTLKELFSQEEEP